MACARIPSGPTDAHLIYESEYARSGKPRVRGVGRVADEPRALLVMLTTVPTDDQLRELHNFLRDWRAA